MKTILLVEDDPLICDIYSIALKKEGYKVGIGNSRQMALEKMKNNHYDLLILDLNLNKNFPSPKDGLDILELMRNDPKTKNLKTIVISNYTKSEYPELSDLSNLGVIKYFLKVENTPEEIVNSVKEILGDS